eukprot:CAMPEP_0202443990 /NCGR_PEP_ID=MMETSP1360-20130828/3158_1 /ASSEMBLY_ACC=CAM_ASM_000848 /TAXON_ID=515479 /ORGANISM="Licmophora paradoxa, Strain CCMP2313" /LENGTH=264 /DNA_ID=CAMNT_0049059853 /DNA_START=45 /DNA_END=839 /DNA_ORIENTATION=+
MKLTTSLTLSFISTIFAITEASSLDGKLTRFVGDLEKSYIQSCERNSDEVPGFYGAFLEPCEFAFFQSSVDGASSSDPCGKTSVPVDTPVPMHWVLNLTQHFKNQDWDSSFDWNQMSSDDLPNADDLMLWPDRCVGVAPRCYPIVDGSNEAIHATLSKLFDEIPMEATHVRVDCRADGLAISRTVYAVAEGLEIAGPTLTLWALTLFVVFFSSLFLCFATCLYCCCGRRKVGVSSYVAENRGEPIVAKGVYVKLQNDDDGDEKA